MVKKPRCQAPSITVEKQGPVVRRVQNDVKWLPLTDGVSWVYLEDAASRMCLSASVGPIVNQEKAAEALQRRHDLFVDFSIDEHLLIQSDGGSDFSSRVVPELLRVAGAVD